MGEKGGKGETLEKGEQNAENECGGRIRPFQPEYITDTADIWADFESAVARTIR